MGLKVNRRLDRQLRHFRIPTEVSFSDDPANARTAMEVIATDRPGVLSQIASAMRFCGVRLQNAKVATFGERRAGPRRTSVTWSVGASPCRRCPTPSSR